MIPFENDLIALVKDIRFRKTNSAFQRKISEDMKSVRLSNKTLTPADKTSNMYRLTKEEYQHHLKNAITATYKKVNKNESRIINKEGIKYAHSADIINKIEINGTGNCFITLKDHKENFSNNPKTRLINPAKNEIGRISKVLVEKINVELINTLKVNEWKDTKPVINWFKNIKNKKQYKFLMFDIKDFYPSIKANLLHEALQYARNYINISSNDYEVVFHSRKSLLYNDNQPWMKKENSKFDVTMGAYDGAEICELIGIFMLSLLSKKCDIKNIGLYRDDGLAIFKNISGPEAEKIKKDFQKIFKEKGLEITVECNRKTVNYLDITLDLNNGSFQPYRKPNDETQYIHIESDHPPNIKKQLPRAIEKRLSNLSSSKEIFEKAASYYEKCLKDSGFNEKLTYQQDGNTGRRNRKRNIIWFNPPYSKSVKTNVGKYFFKLTDKHFPSNNKLHKIFNKNTLKLSYSCMPNLKSKINSHNKKILENSTQSLSKKCNCIVKENCPLKGECLTNNVLYHATITCDDQNYTPKLYKGICETTFKKRYANHKKSFNIERYKNDTKLSIEYWNLKENQKNPKISWKIKNKFKPYTPDYKRCQLCINEKLEILNEDDENLLNKKSEIISQCRHRNKYKLKQLASDTNYTTIT